MKLKTETFKHKVNDKLVLNLKIRAYENKSLLGFLSLGIEEENKVVSFFNDLQILKNKEGKVFIKEPQQKYQDKDGSDQYSLRFLLRKALKEDLAKIITEKYSA